MKIKLDKSVMFTTQLCCFSINWPESIGRNVRLTLCMFISAHKSASSGKLLIIHCKTSQHFNNFLLILLCIFPTIYISLETNFNHTFAPLNCHIYFAEPLALPGSAFQKLLSTMRLIN